MQVFPMMLHLRLAIKWVAETIDLHPPDPLCEMKQLQSEEVLNFPTWEGRSAKDPSPRRLKLACILQSLDILSA